MSQSRNDQGAKAPTLDTLSDERLGAIALAIDMEPTPSPSWELVKELYDAYMKDRAELRSLRESQRQMEDEAKHYAEARGRLRIALKRLSFRVRGFAEEVSRYQGLDVVRHDMIRSAQSAEDALDAVEEDESKYWKARVAAIPSTEEAPQ